MENDRIKFELSEQETVDAEKFYEEHKDCCKKVLRKEFFSTTGGGFSYIITPTGLGDCVKIQCNSCGKIEDITDISCW